MTSTRLKVHRGRMLAICLMLSIPAIEACGVLFDPSHGSITGTWVRRFPNEEPVTSWPFPPRWTLRVTETSDGAVTGTIMKETFSDPTPPPELRRPPQVWTVEGSRRGAKVRLDFKDNGAVRQYFEGKQVDQNVIEGSVSPREGSEHRVMVEFERRH
ncbi:hypothetical protein [Candidatus Palauibacter sp.]|uniref:hypothetical protein n=1 Tax=Candidatus Palauibacter sp. TaxID=3101350 RepID=UPI003C6EC367